MPLRTLQIPPVKDLHDLSQVLRDINLDISKDYVCSVELGTKGKDAGNNLVVFNDEKTESLVPTLREFPGSLAEEELAGKAAALQDVEKLVVRSYGSVLLGTEKKWVIFFESEAARPSPRVAIGVQTFLQTKAKVQDRGVPPDSFLQELVEWGRSAPSEIFEDKTTPETDIYASVVRVFGPYGDLIHRKACMLEAMRVLAGFESSWDWKEGRDTKNTASSTPRNEWEAGAWQVSSNSIGFGKDLKALVLREVKSVDPDTFRKEMMDNHPFAMEYIARLLRHTIRHNGPVKRNEIHKWLSTDAVKEFQQLLTS